MLNNRLASLEIENQALSQQLVELDEQARGANERIKALREADGPLHTLQLNRDVVEGSTASFPCVSPNPFQAMVRRSATTRPCGLPSRRLRHCGDTASR